MCKQRLYEAESPLRAGAVYALRRVLLTTLKLFAPFLPFVTEEIYLGLFCAGLDENRAARASIHTSAWPEPDPALEDRQALEIGELLVAAATAVRRYKSENNLPLGSELKRLQLAAADSEQARRLQEAAADLSSITRARQVQVSANLDPDLVKLQCEAGLMAAIEP
jgi:valyl-tRNA synthetase